MNRRTSKNISHRAKRKLLRQIIKDLTPASTDGVDFAAIRKLVDKWSRPFQMRALRNAKEAWDVVLRSEETQKTDSQGQPEATQ